MLKGSIEPFTIIYYKMKNYLIILLLYFTHCAFGQYWEQSYVSDIKIYGRNSIETYDGGVLIAGFEKELSNMTSSGGRIILIKTDRNGQELIRKTIGQFADDFGAKVCLTKDNGFVLYGEEFKYDEGNSFIMKFNSCYELEWTRIFGAPNEYDAIWDIVELEDGSFYTVNFFSSNRIRVFKISAEGEVLFVKNYLPGGFDAELGRNYGNAWARNILVTHDNGLLLGGNIYIEDFDIGQHVLKSFVLKLDSVGNREWLYAFGVDSGYVNNQNNPIELADSSILVLCNYINYPGVDGMVSYCYKLNKEGELLWHKLIDTVGQSNMAAVLFNDSTIFLLTSSNASQSSIDVEGRVRVLKMDTSGVLLDAATYAEDKYSTTAESISITSDQKMLICGQQYDNGITSVYVLKIQSDLSIDTFTNEVLNYDTLCSHSITDSFIAFDTALSIINVGKIQYELKVYPNPTQNELFFEINTTEKLEYSLQLYSSLGSLVYKQENITNNLLKVNVVDLSSGLYYYTINYKGSLVGNGKFVKE